MCCLLFFLLSIVNSLVITRTKESLIKGYASDLEVLFLSLPVDRQSAIFISRLIAVPEFSFAGLFNRAIASSKNFQQWLQFFSENAEFIPRILPVTCLLHFGFDLEAPPLWDITSSLIQKYHGMIITRETNFQSSFKKLEKSILLRAASDDTVVIESYKFCKSSHYMGRKSDLWKTYSSLCLAKSNLTLSIYDIVFEAATADVENGPDAMLKILRLIWAATMSKDANLKPGMERELNELAGLGDNAPPTLNIPLLEAIGKVWFQEDDPGVLSALYDQMRDFIKANTEANSRMQNSFIIDLLTVGIKRGVSIDPIVRDFQEWMYENNGLNLRPYHFAGFKHLFDLTRRFKEGRAFLNAELTRNIMAERFPQTFGQHKRSLEARLQGWQFKYRRLFSREFDMANILDRLIKNCRIKVFVDENFPEILRAHTEDILELENNELVNNMALGHIILSAMANNVKLGFPELKAVIEQIFTEAKALNGINQIEALKTPAHLFWYFRVDYLFKPEEIQNILIG